MTTQYEIPAHAITIDVEALARSHGRKLFHFIRKHLGNPAEAEDLMQAAYVEALRCSDTFRGGSKPESWLFGIAMNLIRHHLSRAPERRFKFEDETALDEHVGNSSDPADEVAHQQLMRRAEHALAALPSDMRSTLELVLEEDLSYEDAANLLQVPVGTVRSRLSRARAQLREAVLN
ncbi:RNA polymerase sigma factor [Chitinimonas koreensis]|uniref:RNA polymerase sigma factor n=1 Tax=Chitinimonas koreensis TaxID=356302 RepID=UPI000419E3E1|nr:RNA polymerase sigma factor [Chitinimonas koreensis]